MLQEWMRGRERTRARTRTLITMRGTRIPRMRSGKKQRRAIVFRQCKRFRPHSFHSSRVPIPVLNECMNQESTMRMIVVTSCSSVKRIKDSASQSFPLGFNQLQESAWKDHDRCLHSLQLAEEPRVGRDEDVLYETTLCLPG